MRNTSKDMFKQTIHKHLDADAYNLFFIYTFEEVKAIKLIKEVSKERGLKFYTYDISEGLRSEDDNRLNLLTDESLRDLNFALRWIEKNAKSAILCLVNPLPIFEADPRVVRLLKNLSNTILEQHLRLKIFLISPFHRIPDELQLDVAYIDLPLPSREEISNKVKEFAQALSQSIKSELVEMFANSLQGLREIDIENILHFCALDGKLTEDDLLTIVELKKQIIKRETLLEFIITEESINNIGGLKTLKEWIKKKGIIIKNIESAKSFGVSMPKGVLIFGMPGCGKSLSAKVIANEWKLPLLRLDMGIVLGPYVGQSEENIRRAIKVAEAISPCILWIDELEKGFAGASETDRGGASDVMKRIFSTLLTWMQEKTKPVFIVAVANDISNMPPEFLRKGRFDEIFFVDFPKVDEIKEILKIHLKKRRKENWYKALESYAQQMKTRGFSGADVEYAVNELVERAFVAKHNSDNFDPKAQFNEVLKEFKSISEVMKNKVGQIRKKFREIGARSAN